jgi:hypothetical protein
MSEENCSESDISISCRVKKYVLQTLRFLNGREIGFRDLF